MIRSQLATPTHLKFELLHATTPNPPTAPLLSHFPDSRPEPAVTNVRKGKLKCNTDLYTFTHPSKEFYPWYTLPFTIHNLLNASELHVQLPCPRRGQQHLHTHTLCRATTVTSLFPMQPCTHTFFMASLICILEPPRAQLDHCNGRCQSVLHARTCSWGFRHASLNLMSSPYSMRLLWPVRQYRLPPPKQGDHPNCCCLLVPALLGGKGRVQQCIWVMHSGRMHAA